MKNRCVIRLGTMTLDTFHGRVDVMMYVSRYKTAHHHIHAARVYGSHSEAKVQLPKWLTAWPDAKIVDAGDVT